jgi:hypothetical protein
MKFYWALLLLLSAPLHGSVCGGGTEQPLERERGTNMLHPGVDGCPVLILGSPCASLLP